MAKHEAQFKTVYVDNDDDEMEFLDADKEEAKDMADNQNDYSEFMVSVANKQSMLGRSSLNADVKLEFMQSLAQPGPRGETPIRNDEVKFENTNDNFIEMNHIGNSQSEIPKPLSAAAHQNATERKNNLAGHDSKKKN